MHVVSAFHGQRAGDETYFLRRKGMAREFMGKRMRGGFAEGDDKKKSRESFGKIYQGEKSRNVRLFALPEGREKGPSLASLGGKC